MPTTTVTLEPTTARRALAHRVYLRASWFDAWVRIPWLFAEEIAWRIAPSLSTAALAWQYGYAMRQGELTPAIVQRLSDRRRQYIKIEVDAHPVTEEEFEDGAEPLRWFGMIELDARVREGLFAINNGQYIERGDQPIAAVGLEQCLYRSPVRGATFLDTDGAPKRAERPFVFNRPNAAGQPAGNRSASRGARSYLFSSQVYGDDKFWNSRTILEYLVANETPKGQGGIGEFSIFVDDDYRDFLPDWDQPVIDPRDHTAGDLLNLLMPRTRMLSWYLRVDTSESDVNVNLVRLVPVSLFGEAVTTDLGTFKANPLQLALQTTPSADASPELQYQLKESDIPRIDQARVRGARRTSTCTLSRADQTIGEGWPLALELEYNDGYSGAVTYGSMTKAAQQVANAEIRDSDRLHSVYRRFAIPEFWDQKVKDGLNGGVAKAVFLDDPSTVNLKRVCPREIELAPKLPMMAGYDYSNIGSPTFRIDPTKFADDTERLPALVLFKLPYKIDPDNADEAARYVPVEKIGAGGRIPLIEQHVNLAWSGRVEIPHQDRSVEIDVQGQPQHVLAWTDFEPLSVDEDPGRWDSRDALFTVCIYDDRFAEGVFPSDSDADEEVANVKRELLVDAGSAYQLDYLVPGTVIGIDAATQGLKRSTNGGWIHDDRKLLTARATQIFQYYGQTRRTLTLLTSIITAQIAPGAYVSSFGREGFEREVGTVVSEIELTIPGGDGSLAPPRIKVSTAFAELEPSALLNRPHVQYHTTPEHVPLKRLGNAGGVKA